MKYEKQIIKNQFKNKRKKDYLYNFFLYTHELLIILT